MGDESKKRGQPESNRNQKSGTLQHKQATEICHEGEDKYQALIDNAPIGILVIQDGKRVLYNSKVPEIFGYPRNEYEQLDFTSVAHPDDRDRVVEHMRKRMTDDTMVSNPIEVRIIQKSGEMRWVETNSNKIMWNGKPALQAFISDITDRKEAEKALIESERKYRLLADHATDVVWMMNFDGSFIYVSPSVVKLTGHTPEEVLNISVWDYVTPDYAQQIQSLIMEQLALPAGERLESYTLEAQQYHKDGSIVDVEFSATWLKDKNGEPIGIQGISRGISDRKLAERKRHEALAKTRSYVENAPYGVFIANERGEYLEVNPAAAEITGYSQEELVGMSIMDVIPPESHEIGHKHFMKVVTLGKARGEMKFRRKEGTYGWWSVDAVRLSDSRFLGFVSDISESKLAEDELNNQRHLFDQVLAASSVGLAYAIDRKIIWANRAMEELFALSKEEYQGRDTAMLYRDEEEYKRIGEIVYGQMQQKEPAQFDAIFRKKDGSLFWGHTKVNVLDSDNPKAGIILSIIDISDRKQSDEDLRESEERYRSFVSHSSEGIYRVDIVPPVSIDIPEDELIETINKQAVVAEVNDALAKMYGLTPEEMVGKPAVEFAPNYGKRAVLVLNNPEYQVANEETEDIDKDGESIFLIENYHGEVVDGQLLRIWGVQHDVTENRRAQEELRRSEAKYRLLADNASDVIWTRDLNFKTTYISPSIKNMRGFTPEEAMNQSLTEVMTPASAEYTMKQLAEEAERERKNQGDPLRSRTLVVEMYHKNGGTIWVEVTSSYMHDKDGNPAGIVGISRDITERIQAEKALRESEETFRALAENSIDTIMRFDKEHRHLYVNPIVESQAGIKAEDFLGKTHKELGFPEDLCELWGSAIGMVFQTGKKARIEFKLPSDLWIDWLCMPEFDESGEVKAVITSARDITEKKLAVAEIRESEEKFRTIAEQSSDVIALTDSEGIIIYCSPASEQMFQYKPEEMIGHHFVEFLDESSYSTALGAFQDSVGQGQFSSNLELLMKKKDGSTFFGELNGSSYRFGSEPGTLVIIRDITERKRAEEELVKLAAVVKRSSELINLATLDGKMIFLNEAGGKMLGIDSGEVSKVKIMDVFSDHWVELVQSEIFPTLMKGGTWEGELQYRNLKTGQLTDVHAMTFTINNPDTGEPQYFANVSLDITDRKQAEEEKIILEEQLRQSQKMEAIGRLAGGVAHDFNNLLTGISGYSQMIQASLGKGDPIYADVEEIRKAAERAGSLTAQLLAFSRKQIVAPKVVQPNDILNHSMRMVQRIIGEDIDLALSPAVHLGHIKIDPAQLDQVLVNLAVNARDAMPGGGKLTIETQNVLLEGEKVFVDGKHSELIGEYVMLAVSDNGSGMDEETKKRIFEPFFSTKPKDQGTGLGLATVYGVVRQNNGFIKVYSELNSGTTFKIYFPRIEEQADELERDELADLPRGEETILLVEDEDLVRGLAKRILKKQGYKVMEADDGGDAYLQSKQHEGKIHLLLTDVIMPNMNGKQLHDELLTIRPGIKALFMSGYTENVIARHGVLDKGTRFIQKPFTVESLAIAVRKALDN